MVSAGIGDPYWYEWYVGLSFVIKMLNSDNGIESVVFQKGDYHTIDDVVVKYKDGAQEYCYQVKSENELLNRSALTFNEVVKQDRNGKSLIKSLAEGWDEASRITGHDIIPVLFTNKTSGKSSLQRTYNNKTYKAAPLGDFIVKIKKKISKSEESGKLCFTKSERDLQLQWLEFSNATEMTESLLLSFINRFILEASQYSLSELREMQINDISTLFSCSHEIAEKLFLRLVAELQVWTTSTRNADEVTVEIVYETLSTKLEISNDQHRLAPPSPFFYSREIFCRNIVCDISKTNSPVVFIEGEPGSGKTSIISHIQAKYDLFAIRYHAFRPISPNQRFYDTDAGLCEPRQLWIELMIQIRSKLKGKLHKHGVPVICEFLSNAFLRSEVLRLLSIINDETSKTVFVCIDGIDHAARSNLQVNFLSSLFSPSEIPKGVCFVIVGQPPNIYNKYPSWLICRDSLVDYITIPPLQKDDIAQLIAQKTVQYSDCAERVAELIFTLTKGNNLSVVYTIETIIKFSSFEELLEFSKSGIITHDVNQYYDNIWQHIASFTISKNIVVNFAESKIAAAILLLNGRIYTKLFNEALKEIPLSVTEWDQLMDSLYPLITPGAIKHEYNIFHNDFRVYLMGVVSRNHKIYKKLSFDLAVFLYENDWGIVKYRNLLPLLVTAERIDLTADYFDAPFVINALAEGLSYSEIDDFALTAYNEVIKSKQLQKYYNVYLALTTVHQHYKYFEYYSKEYKTHDFSDIIPIDISEMRTKGLVSENVDDYYDTLIRCKKLYSTCIPDMQRRALSLYDLWFGEKSPISFIRTLYPDSIYPDDSNYDTSLEETLKLWGRTCAKMSIATVETFDFDLTDVHIFESRAESVFGDAYFSYLIDHGLYSEAVNIVGKVKITVNCIIDKLDDLLLSGNAGLFKDILKILLSQEINDSDYMFTLAILLVVDPIYNGEIKAFDLNQTIKHLHDNTTMSAVANAYIIGSRNYSRDEIILINQAYACLDIEDKHNSKKREVDYLKLLIRIAVLLGKYNYLLCKTPETLINGDLLHDQLNAFFENSAVRSFEFSKAFNFLLFVILNTPTVNKLLEHNTIYMNLKHALFTFQYIGMFYKTIILDYLLRQNQIDIVKEYLLVLYGESGESLYKREDWASTHNHFLKYSSDVIPEISSIVSARLKWDVVSYIGHDEYALGVPLDIYRKSTEHKPESWETQGVRLNNLSIIADNFSNGYSFDIIETLSENAASCGLEAYWKLHHISSNFHYNLSILHMQLKHSFLLATTEQDIIAIWILACGLLSWYDNYDRGLLQNIYNACFQKENEIGSSTFINFAKKYTPSQFDIATKETWTRNSSDSTSDDYLIEKKQRNKKIESEIKKLTAKEIVEQYICTNSRFDSWDSINIAWNEIRSRNEMDDSILKQIVDIISVKLADCQWQHDGCHFILDQLRDILGSEAFWLLADVVGTNLLEYNYQTAVRNSSFLISLFFELFNDDKMSALDAELQCQELWITGCNNIPFPKTDDSMLVKFPTPRSMHELALSILLEQFDINNIHRNEIALPAIYTLCINDFSLFLWLSDNWEKITHNQRDAIILICERWVREAPNGIETLINVLKEEYNKSNKITEKMKLYSILSNYGYTIDLPFGELTFEASPIQYTLSTAKRDFPYSDKFVPPGINAFLSINERYTDGFDQGLDIVKFINNNYIKEKKQSEQFFRDGDCILVKSSAIQSIDPVLYGEEKCGRWDHLPFEWHMQYFLDIDDAWIVTTPPIITFDDIWDVEKELKECIEKNNLKKAEAIAQIIIHSGLTQNEQVLGSCLFYPVGYYNDGIIVFSSLKVINKGEILCNNRIYQTFINYSILSIYDNLYEHGIDNFHKDGINLVRSIVGSAHFVLGNCQIYPTCFLQKAFGWAPLFTDPFIWVDENNNNVLKFERIINPNREKARQNYIRQPILFRWIANKSKLNSQLDANGLLAKMVNNTIPYNEMFYPTGD